MIKMASEVLQRIGCWCF